MPLDLREINSYGALTNYFKFYHEIMHFRANSHTHNTCLIFMPNKTSYFKMFIVSVKVMEE